MTTVIDSLTVEFGIDSRKFTEGERDVMSSFKKAKEGAAEFGKSVEHQGAMISEVFGMAKKGVLGVIGGFIGAEAVSFIDHMTNMDAATGRWAKTIGIQVENLGIWQSMVRQVVGAAEDATSSMSALQDQINNVRMGSGMFDNQFGFLLNKIGGAQGKNADQILRELQAYFATEIKSGRMTPADAATQLRWVPGMNQNMINLLLSDLKKIEDAARAVGGATDETSEAAAKLQSKFSLITQAFERFAASTIPVIDLLMKPLKDWTKGDVNTFLPKMTFDKGSIMDRLDTWLWGEYGQHDMAPPASFNDRFGAVGAGSSSGGSTRGDRNNNPGNIKFGTFAQAHGATGQDDRGFAIFPTSSLGSAAQVALVTGTSYSGLTLDQFAARYAEGSPAWERTVGGAMGIGGGDIVNNQDPRLIDAIRRAEGTSQGARGAAAARGGGSTSTSTSTSEVNIGNIHVNAPNATDADGIAREIGPAMKRSSITSPANSGLV